MICCRFLQRFISVSHQIRSRMLPYCSPDESLKEPWTKHGFSHCFLDTATYIVLFGFLVITGTIQAVMYRRYSTPLEKRFQPRSWLYKIQILLSVLMTVQGPVRVLLQLFLIEPKKLYIYQILVGSFSAVMWPLSLTLMCLERKRLLPSIPARGHGLILLLFWTLAFVTENLAFISWFSPNWWWHKRE